MTAVVIHELVFYFLHRKQKQGDLLINMDKIKETNSKYHESS